jgi:hypothetical protein
MQAMMMPCGFAARAVSRDRRYRMYIELAGLLPSQLSKEILNA